MSSTPRANTFEILKRIMKTRGLTYADLATGLAVSEPTIKRLFAERDCKLSRLEAICRWLDVSLGDILESSERIEQATLVLPRDVERALAASGDLFHFFLLLREDMSASDIASAYSLDSADVYLYARDLERLGLLDIEPGNVLRLRSTATLSLNLDGPLRHRYIDLNLAFIRHCLKGEPPATANCGYRTLSRRLHPESARLVQEELDELLRRITMLARQDQMFTPQEELQPFKWAFASAVDVLPELLQLSPHPDKRQD